MKLKKHVEYLQYFSFLLLIACPPLTHSCRHTRYYKVNLTPQGALQVGKNLTIWRDPAHQTVPYVETQTLFVWKEKREQREAT